MRHTLLLSVLVVAVLAALAGCATPTTTPEQQAVPTLASAPPETVGLVTTKNGSMMAMFIHDDGSLQAAPPEAERRVPLGEPANGPWVESYPEWSGKLPATNATVLSFKVFVTSGAVNLRAKDVFVVEDIPAFWVSLSANGSSYAMPLDGPQVIKSGDIVELNGSIAIDEGWDIPADSDASLRIAVFYTTVGVVSDIEFLVGPTHPSGFQLE